MPILGVIASSTRQGQNVDTGAIFALQTIIVSSAGASSVTFNNIPSTYQNLQIRGVARTTRTDVVDSLSYRFNGDTGTNYAWHGFRGDGTGFGAERGTSSNRMEIDRCIASNTAVANTFGGFVTDIYDYASTNKNKTIKTLAGMTNYTSNQGFCNFYSGVWLNTSAVTSITIYGTNGNLTQYSQFALYGIKGA